MGLDSRVRVGEGTHTQGEGRRHTGRQAGRRKAHTTQGERRHTVRPNSRKKRHTPHRAKAEGTHQACLARLRPSLARHRPSLARHRAVSGRKGSRAEIR